MLVYTLQSMPGIEREFRAPLRVFEYVTVAVFTIEYLARLRTAAEDPPLAAYGPRASRLRMAGRPIMPIDLLAIAPTYIALFVPVFEFRVLRMAVRPTRLLALTSADFEALLCKHPELKTRLAKLMAERADGIASQSEISQEEIDAARNARDKARRFD